MSSGGGRHSECKVEDIVTNHKLLYRKLVQKLNVDLAMVSPEVWARAQDKSFRNGLKDFNWLHLHRRLPVRTTMYAHNLGKQKDCPRMNCAEEETIDHVL